uniref:Uncharacterized protein n=1 Tax=Alexandrium monilatum TaxID=311494 RepID=A0A7S4UX67_9DINO
MASRLATRRPGALLCSVCQRRGLAARGGGPRAPLAAAPGVGRPGLWRLPGVPQVVQAGRHILQRGAAAQASDEDENLVATAEAEVAKLGGAIAARVRSFGRASVRSIGSKAAYRCLKAVVNAADYLRQDAGASPDRVLAVSLSEQVARQSDAADAAKRTVMIFEAELREAPPGGEGQASKELIVGAATNAGRAAAAIAAVMRQGQGAGALVRAIGANAVHQALVSAALARKYLENDGDGVRFVVVPSFEDQNSPPKGVKPIRQLVFRILRV